MRYALKAKPAVQALLCALTLVISSLVNALSLSDIRVSSAVGERFYGIIKINDIQRTPPEQILVAIAPRSIYQRMGVDWEYFHSSLIFDVVSDERQGVYIRIVSSDVVYEPYLDFVLSLRWPSGYMTKQYTVLLDMPTNRPTRESAAAKPVLVKPIERQSVVVERETQAAQAVAEPASKVIEAPAQSNAKIQPAGAPVSVLPQAKLQTTKSLDSEKGEGKVSSSDEDTDTGLTTLTQPQASDALGDAPVITPYDEAPAGLQGGDSASSADEQPNSATAIDFKEAAADIVAPDFEQLTDTDETASQDELQESLIEQVTDASSNSVNDEAAQNESVKNEVVQVAAEKTSATKPPNTSPDLVATSRDTQSTANRSSTSDALQEWQVATNYGDTLWSIARRIQAESGGRTVDIVQALYRNNENAFLRNDINRLRADANLRITIAQIREATPVDRRQLLNTVDDGATQSAQVAKQDDSSAEATSNAVQQDGVLSLVAEDLNDDKVSPEVQSIAQRFQQRTQEIDQQQANNQRATEAVEAKVENLVEQYRALSEKTRQLKELEVALNRSIAEKAQVEMGLTPPPSQSSSVGIASPVAVPAPDVSDIKAGKALHDTPSESLLSWQRVWPWLLGLLLVTLAVLLSVWYMRRQQVIRDIEAIKDWDNDIFLPPGELEMDERAEPVELKGESAFLTPIKAQEMTDYISLDAEDGSVELQAGLYIAYERYDEAERLLMAALEHRPDNSALKSHLLEVYAAQGRIEEFEQLANQLTQSGSDQIIKKIEALRS